MSDPTGWQPPEGAERTPPRYGEYAPPGYVVPGAVPPAFPPPASPAPAPGPSGYGQPHPQGWTPPPKPGLIPLRPLTLGTMLGASLQVMRRNPKPTFGVTLLLYSAAILVYGLVIAGFVAYAFGRISTAAPDDQGAIISGTVLAGGLTLLIPAAATVLVSAFVQGIVTLEVARATLGEKLTTRQLVRHARGRIGALFGWSLLVSAVVLVVVVLVAAVVTAIIVWGGSVGVVVGILLAVLAAIAAAVLYAWIGTKLSLVPSALLLERLSIRAAVARSWSLTTGSFWKTLGIQLLVTFIVNVAVNIISQPLGLAGTFVIALVVPTGDETAGVIALIVVELVTLATTVLLTSVGLVMQSATVALIYIDLRMRREGLDLELARFVEARQADDASVVDPYLLASSPSGPPSSDASPWR
jgi:hypothetical protein